MLTDILVLVVLLITGLGISLLLMRRRRSNSLPVNEPEDSLTRLVRHFDDL